MQKNILLVSPDFDIESFWISDDEGTCAEVLNDVAPLGLATLAGMTPDEFHVDIWDEVVHGRIQPDTKFDRQYDLVGVTGYEGHIRRCRELADIFRQRAILVAAGGPGVSGVPDRYRSYFDILFIGEAEQTWPRFLQDWKSGAHKSVYRQIEKLDLSQSPLPNWESLAEDMHRYALGAVQTTRGCPFDCEFCDVIYLFGRKPRHKPIENVLQEVAQMEQLGTTHVLFCDDEFIGDPRYTKELLRQLIPLNNSFSQPLTFMTQLTMNLSKDEELLELAADANFGLLFIGIETPNKESLKETSKFQNVRKDLVGDVRKILSYGIAIRAGLIVGFDNDGPDVFEQHFDFVHQARLPSATLSMLKAIRGTRLWRRMRQEGRVLDITQLKGDTKATGEGFKPRSYTNIVPMRMTRIQLMQGYRDLAARIYSWESFGKRMRDFVSGVTRLPRVPEKRLSPGELENLMQAGGDDATAEPQIRSLVDYTLQVAPRLMRRVRMLILQHARHAATFSSLLPSIDRLVEQESSGNLTFSLDARPVPVPEAFRAVYDDIFPDVYRRVYDNLNSKADVPEALTEVFVDFLVRWGNSFSRFGEHHREFFHEICDRTCAKFNGEPPEQFQPRDGANVSVDLAKRWRLAEDVMRSVEQELVRITGGRIDGDSIESPSVHA